MFWLSYPISISFHTNIPVWLNYLLIHVLKGYIHLKLISPRQARFGCTCLFQPYFQIMRVSKANDIQLQSSIVPASRSRWMFGCKSYKVLILHSNYLVGAMPKPGYLVHPARDNPSMQRLPDLSSQKTGHLGSGYGKTRSGGKQNLRLWGILPEEERSQYRIVL